MRLGEGAAAIEIAGGRVTSVRTTGGEQLQTRAVVSACHVLTTVALAEDGLPAGLAERSRRAIQVGNGIGVALRLGTRDLPAYPGAPGDVHAGLGLIAPDRAMLAAAHGDHAGGRTPRKPPVIVMGFSAVDASLAPPGHH